MSSLQKTRKSKEATWTETELSREMKRNSKEHSERERKRRDGQTTKHVAPQSSPKLAPGSPKTSSPVKITSKTHSGKISKSTTKDPVSTAVHSPKIPSKVSSKVDSPLHSPKLRHSPKQQAKDQTRTKNRRSDDKNEHKRREVKEPHPLVKSKTVHVEADEVIEEDIRMENDTSKTDDGNDKEIKDNIVIQMEEVTSNIQEEIHYSDEEFEDDYEDDFEETSDKSDEVPSLTDINNIMQAIDNENVSVVSTSSVGTIPSAPPLVAAALSPRSNISFTSSVSAIKAKETNKKIKTRGDELGNMIERDILCINLLELEPLTEYDLYMRSFGTDNTSQTGTQTGENLVEGETQTDIILHGDRWTQYPPHNMRGYGGGGDNEDDMDLIANYDSENLLKFLKEASLVCFKLLEEELAAETIARDMTTSYSDSYCTLDMTLASNGPIQSIDWDIDQSNMLMVACVSGLLEVWQLSCPSKPQYHLLVHSVPTSCSLRYPLAFSGNDDGSITLWDLREPHWTHRNWFGTIPVRVPTYTTAPLVWDGGHFQPVIKLTPSATQHDNQLNSSCQLMSMDVSGRVCVWIVVEMTEGDPAGNSMDVGLAPNGRVKLVASAFIDIMNNNSPTTIAATYLAVNGHTLLVGTNSGNVIHHVRYKSSVVPKRYTLKKHEGRVESGVSCISFHPLVNEYFLVSFTDGRVALYNITSSHPLVVLSHHGNDNIDFISWHPSWSSVFVCASSSYNISIWDLLQSDSQPIHIIKLHKKILTVSMANDGNSSYMIVGNEKDEVGLYRFESKQFHRSNRLEQFNVYLSTLI